MKSREQIDEEYKNFESKSDFVVNLEEFKLYLQLLIEDREEKLEDLNDELEENRLFKLEAEIRNFFFFIFEEEEVSFYDEDNEILEKYISFEKVFKDYFESILFIARDYNYERLLKFCDFLIKHYEEHIEYIDYLRERLEKYYQGIVFYNPKYENNREAMIGFYFDNMARFEEEFDKREGYEGSECIELRKMKAKWNDDKRVRR